MYVQILHLAAQESQDAVADALRHLLATEHTLDVERVRELVANATRLPAPTDITVEAPDLCEFDSLLTTFDKECPNHDQGNTHQTSDASFKEEETTNGETRSDVAVDRPAEGTASADNSRSVSGIGGSSSDGEPEPPSVSFRTDNAGMRGSERRPHQTTDDTIETSSRQDMGSLVAGVIFFQAAWLSTPGR